MDVTKALVKRVAVWTVLGVVGGGVAADMLWRQKGAQEQANLHGQQTEELQRLDRTAWRREVIGHEELFLDLHDRLPKELVYERELLICRL